TLAWMMALYANCSDPRDGEACRECDSCLNIIKAIQNGTDGRSVIEKPVSERGIDAIRALESQARYHCRDRYWWFIIDEVHNLTKPAFDAALRLWEKPPQQARFILCTTAPEALPRTVLSRSFIFNLEKIPADVTAKKLLWPICKREKFDIGKDTLLQIAEKVSGHPRDALNLLTQWIAASEGGVEPEDIPKLLSSLEASAPYEAILHYCKSIVHGKTNKALYVLNYMTRHEYFIDRVIEQMQQILYRWVHAEHLADVRYEDDMMEINPVVPKEPKAKRQCIIEMGQVLRLCLDAQDRIKQYRCNNRAVLEQLAIEITGITAAWDAR
ncbi:hypothetical protein LCGC14_0829530, partial [marine sediment metagenome]